MIVNRYGNGIHTSVECVGLVWQDFLLKSRGPQGHPLGSSVLGLYQNNVPQFVSAIAYRSRSALGLQKIVPSSSTLVVMFTVSTVQSVSSP